MKNAEHKPCPFCGRGAFESLGHGRGGWFVFIECSFCGARTKAEFAGKWNDPDHRPSWVKWDTRAAASCDREGR